MNEDKKLLVIETESQLELIQKWSKDLKIELDIYLIKQEISSCKKLGESVILSSKLGQNRDKTHPKTPKIKNQIIDNEQHKK